MSFCRRSGVRLAFGSRLDEIQISQNSGAHRARLTDREHLT